MLSMVSSLITLMHAASGVVTNCLLEAVVSLLSDQVNKYIDIYNLKKKKKKSMSVLSTLKSSNGGSQRKRSSFLSVSLSLLALALTVGSTVAEDSAGGDHIYFPPGKGKSCQSSPYEYRTYDGTCNNLLHPDWGKAHSLFLHGPEGTAFQDGKSEPIERGVTTRHVSNTLATVFNNQHPEMTRPLSLLSSAFGQFVVHDISGGVVQNETFDIPLRPDDPFSNFPFPGARDTMPVGLSEGGIGKDGTFSQLSEVTAYLDLSPVYGNDEERGHKIRTGYGGLLKTQDYNNFCGVPVPNLPPGSSETLCVNFENFIPNAETVGLEEPDAFEDNGNLRIALTTGDVRSSQNIGLFAMQLLFLREHNRVAKKLKKKHPYWGDEKLFQEARNFVVAEYQKIVYGEFLTSLLGSQSYKLGEYKGYNPHVHPQLESAFEGVAMRYGHSTIPEIYPLYDQCYNKPDAGEQGVIGGSGVGIPDPLLGVLGTAKKMEYIVRGLCTSPMKEVDVAVVEPLRNAIGGAFDLFTINMQRARLNGVPDYDTIRQYYFDPKKSRYENSVYSYPGCRRGSNFDSIQCFLAITKNRRTARKLRSLFKHADNIDPLAGGFAEDHVPGSTFGPTFGNIIARQFRDIRHADRLYWENSYMVNFYPKQLKEIKSVTLGKLLEYNFDVKLQDNVFYQPRDFQTIAPKQCHVSPEANGDDNNDNNTETSESNNSTE
eukprot:gb/GECH01011216.1/.p1 GENE.gb/GECH01011216.1/~~gb/GECH01011216.1/.p1  ORF type:complete len:712 (+),score=157.33 gb/GECH01011216.1/:1-2136(+)